MSDEATTMALLDRIEAFENSLLEQKRELSACRKTIAKLQSQVTSLQMSVPRGIPTEEPNGKPRSK